MAPLDAPLDAPLATPLDAPHTNPPAPRPLDRKVVTRPRRDGERWCFTIDAGTDSDIDTRWTGEFIGGGQPVPNSAFVIARADKTTSYACGKLDDAPTRTVRLYPPGGRPPGSAQR